MRHRGTIAHVSQGAIRTLNDKLLLKDDLDTLYVTIHIRDRQTFSATVEDTPYRHIGSKVTQTFHNRSCD